MKIDKPKNLIKSKNLIFFAINTIAHLAIIPAILYGEWWMWILGILWGYLVNCTGNLAGYHRYYAHRSFKAPRWYDYYYQIIALFGNTGPTLIWGGIHQMHHKYVDTDIDPHSPAHRGFWDVWFIQFRGAIYFYPVTKEDLKDWLTGAKDPVVKWFYSNYLRLITTIIVVFLLIDPLLFVFGFCIPVIMTIHSSAIVNAYTHRKGEPSNTGELLNFILAGEGYHLNHHNNPSNYTTLPKDNKWWQTDLTGFFIRMIKI